MRDVEWGITTTRAVVGTRSEFFQAQCSSGCEEG